MPFGFLFSLALLGLLTLLALIRIRWWGHVLFAAALPAGELAHVAMLFLVLSTALAFSEGDLSGLPGVTSTVLLVVAVVILIGLIVLLVRALSAWTVIDDVLQQHGVARPERRRWVRPLVFPFPWRPSSVVRTGPISYGEDRRQHLDVYRSAHAEECGPVLVYLHGGGYSSGGNRREARALLHRLTVQGWTCISATYRLRPRFGFEDHLADARAVLAWAHGYAEAHGGAGAPVVMAGSSAGGHLSALCALTQDDVDPERPRVDAVVSLYAWCGRYYGRGPDESVASTALALDASKAPPFFIVHGDYDSLVPVEDARALRDHLEEGLRCPVWYAELPGAQHGFDVYASWRLQAVMDGVDGFLRHAVASAPGPALRSDDTEKD